MSALETSTPYQMARKGDADGIRRMLDSGVSPHSTDQFCNPLLHLAAAYGHLEACRLLIER